MTRPFASVLVDTYNHERFIEQAIVSVLEQDFPAADREIIVVDDGSTDRTPELLRKFEPQIRILRKENGGQASAFNAGIPECRGEIVAFLDGDDWWAPGKLAAVANKLKENREIGTIGHGIFEADEAGRQTTVNMPDRVYVTRLRDAEEGREFLPLRAYLGTSRLTVRNEVLKRALPVPTELTVEADEFMATVATALSGALILNQPLTNYRLHGGNLYQFREWDTAKAKRKSAVLDALAEQLPQRLENVGTPRGAVEVLARTLRVEADRLRLTLGEGWPWETVRTENEAYRLAYQRRDFAYRIFHGMVLGVASVMPPASFYRLRAWYAARGLAGVRKQLGKGTPTDTLTQRRMLT
jgi:glycosyltransferase involved in cell wall biosynthesis